MSILLNPRIPVSAGALQTAVVMEQANEMEAALARDYPMRDRHGGRETYSSKCDACDGHGIFWVEKRLGKVGDLKSVLVIVRTWDTCKHCGGIGGFRPEDVPVPEQARLTA